MALQDREISEAYYFYSFAFALYNQPKFLGTNTVLAQRTALLEYLESQYFLGTTELEDYIDEVRKGAEAAPRARLMQEGIKPYLKANMRRLEPLLYVDFKTKQDAVAALVGLVDSIHWLSICQS